MADPETTMDDILERLPELAIGAFNPYLERYARGKTAVAELMEAIDVHYQQTGEDVRTAERAKGLTTFVFEEHTISRLESDGYREI